MFIVVYACTASIESTKPLCTKCGVCVCLSYPTREHRETQESTLQVKRKENLFSAGCLWDGWMIFQWLTVSRLVTDAALKRWNLFARASFFVSFRSVHCRLRRRVARHQRRKTKHTTTEKESREFQETILFISLCYFNFVSCGVVFRLFRCVSSFL